MLKETLSLLNVKDLAVTKHYYSFESNLCSYMIYRDNEYKIFNLESFRHVSPGELITEFFIDEENFRREIVNRSSESAALDQLVDTKFPKALGQFLHLRYLENTAHVERVLQSDIDFFNSLEFLNRKFFMTRFGLSMFTGHEGKDKIPEGMIYFNRFNCRNFGTYRKLLPRVNSEKINVSNEETLVLFSPYSIKDCFEMGKSHFKDSLFIISDTNELTKEDLFPNFSIHIRPTNHELSNYLRYITFYMNQNGVSASVLFTEQNHVKFKSYCQNYGVLRAKWVPILEAQKSNLTGKDLQNEIRVGCVKKNALPGKDLFEFTFPKNPDNMIVFIQYFLFAFYDNTKLNMKKLTVIHYEKEFPEIIEEAVVVDDLDIVDKFTKTTAENDFNLDDEY